MTENIYIAGVNPIEVIFCISLVLIFMGLSAGFIGLMEFCEKRRAKKKARQSTKTPDEHK